MYNHESRISLLIDNFVFGAYSDDGFDRRITKHKYCLNNLWPSDTGLSLTSNSFLVSKIRFQSYFFALNNSCLRYLIELMAYFYDDW